MLENHVLERIEELKKSIRVKTNTDLVFDFLFEDDTFIEIHDESKCGECSECQNN